MKKWRKVTYYVLLANEEGEAQTAYQSYFAGDYHNQQRRKEKGKRGGDGAGTIVVSCAY